MKESIQLNIDSRGKRNYIAWIDYVKVVCLFFVYFNHSSFYCDVGLPKLFIFFLPFYVDAFFIINGYLLFRKILSTSSCGISCKDWLFNEGRTMISNILYRLIFPTVFFSATVFVPKIIIRSQDFSWPSFILATIGGRGFWFTSSLAVAQLSLFLFCCFRPKKMVYYILFAIGLLFFSQIVIEPAEYIWYLRSGLAAMVLIVAGGEYYKHETELDDFFKGYRIVLLVPLMALFVFLLYFSSSVKILGAMGNLNLSGLFCILLSTYILIRICKNFSHSRIVQYIGRNSLLFYFMSGAIPNVIAFLFLKQDFFSGFSMLIIVFVLSIILSYVVVKIINCFVPFLTNFKVLFSEKQ